MIRSIVNFAKAKRFAFRCAAVGTVLVLFAAACLVQLTNIQLLNGKATAQAAAAGRTLQVTVSANRGKILDTNGTVLAQSVERYTIVGDPKVIQTFTPTTCTPQTKGNCHQINGKPVGATGAAAVSRLLAPVLGMNAMTLGAQLSGSSQYVVLKKDVTPTVKRQIDKLNLGGCIYGELSSQRLYSDGTMMGALIGGVNNANVGVAGIEQMQNKALTGTDGYEVFQQGNGGVEIPGTMTKSKNAVNGSDVTLTIDSDVDWYVKQVLINGKNQYKADWAIAMVQDLKTNQIIAIDDSEQITAGSTAAKLNVSKAVSQTFEPGSVGKVFSIAGMLQTGANKITDRYSVPDQITVNGQQYRDAVNHSVSNWTLAGILQQSSNVGMVMASTKYSNAQRYEFLSKFGIGQNSGLGLPGESSGSLSSPQVWDGRTQNTVLFGQGYATNVLQLTNAIATVANKGIKRQQSIIKSVTDANGHTTYPAQPAGTRVIDESVAATTMSAMESASAHYTAFAGVPGYRVAAKSGTAQVPGPNGQLSSIISDWAGVIPADNPRFVVTVVMKNPQGVYGGLTSGPLFKKISEFLMQKYQVPPSTPQNNAIPVTW